MVKAMALTRGYELDSLFQKYKDKILHFFFAGGVVKGKKLKRGKVLIFDEVSGTSKKP